jgi:hypothetical protein
MRADDIGQEKRGYGGANEGDKGESERVIPESMLAVLASWEGTNEFDDATGEEQSKGENGTELDDDRVHLPVGIVKADVEERFADAQMGC